MTKGNYINNWDLSYEQLRTSYSEKLTTPSALSNYVQYKHVLEDIKRYASPSAKLKVVEVGCGGARTALFLAKNGLEVTCADFSPEALRLAKENFRAEQANGTFVEDDLLDSKLEKEFYDCVMSFGLLEHFEDLDPVISGITALLKPGGLQIHTIVPKKFSTQILADLTWYPFRFAKRLLKGQFSGIFQKSFRDFPHYESTFQAEHYCNLLRNSGHEILRCEASGTLYPFISLPFGLGGLLVRVATKPLLRLFFWMDRRSSAFVHKLSPCFYIVARKL